MAKQVKTNVMRILDQMKIAYRPHHWQEVQEIAGERVVFKTLVTLGKSGEHYVFVIPLEATLDLKKAAQAVQEKSIQMIKEKELLPLTGYVHGGCSPIGMKKFFRTSFAQEMEEHKNILFSAGKLGYSVEIASSDIAKLIDYQLADLLSGEQKEE